MLAVYLCGYRVRMNCLARLPLAKPKLGGVHRLIPEAPISHLPPRGHLSEHRFVRIDVIVDNNTALAGVQFTARDSCRNISRELIGIAVNLKLAASNACWSARRSADMSHEQIGGD